ncbi:paralemmin 1a isoform X2 [Scophthalmus maximus]|uniref:paralemmin 1a isoform X2 n=1 Tax=Scophthalmus maximus TaxID=52904 RepID=UPI001FA8BE3A|nr:paralemmin 1a isoform X2 [Scophthalmus maximus]
MEASQTLCQKDPLQLMTSKGLRERWLLDGAPPAGQDQNHQTTNRWELVGLDSGPVCQTLTHTTVSPEVKVHKSPRMNKPRDATEEIKRAMYSVQITVERDRLTGETRVLSTNTTLPVDLSHQGVKVYEDKQKVVHEMNGEDGVHLLSSSEVDELIHKADEALMTSQTDTTVTSFPTSEFQEEAEPELPQPQPPQVSLEITGLEAKPHAGPSAAEASAENPVTMVFMGYQSVEDEAETQKVLGLQGTVTATLVMIHDAEDTTSPGGGGGKDQVDGRAQTAAPPPPASTPPPPPTSDGPHPPPSTAPPPTITSAAAMPAVFEAAEKLEGRVVEMKKEKQPCNCCSIM